MKNHKSVKYVCIKNYLLRKRINTNILRITGFNFKLFNKELNFKFKKILSFIVLV